MLLSRAPRAAARGLSVLALGVGAVLLLWLGAYLVAGDEIPRGTTVLGVPVGGRSAAAAEVTLRRELADDLRLPFAVRVGDAVSEVDPQAAGLRVDLPATAAAAAGRSWNPLLLVRRLRGGAPVHPVVVSDDDRLARAVAAVAQEVDAEPVEGAVGFQGARVVPVQPRQGRRLDRDAAAERIKTAWPQPGRPIRLPARLAQPAVDASEVRRAVTQVAEPAVSTPVTLVVAGTELTLEPETIGAALRLEPDAEQRLQPVLDGAVLRRQAARALRDVEEPAKDATFRIVDGTPRVVPARPGRAVDPAELSAAVVPALTATGAARTASVELRTSEPELTTAAAQALGVRELVSTYTTHYPSGFRPRLINIHRAADLMDDTLVLPGEEFSMNKTVGERTAARGFAAGYIINNGKLAVDYGGGVSQLATTTFNAAFFAGLEDVEHHPHSFYISRYPEGREATVAWGAKDLRFRNDSEHGVFITTGYTNSSVTVRIYGTKRYTVQATKSARYRIRPFKTVHDARPVGTTPGSCVSQDGVVGFTVDVTRIFRQGGRQVRTERFRTVYQPEDRVLCGSSGPRRPTPGPTASPGPTPSPVPSD